MNAPPLWSLFGLSIRSELRLPFAPVRDDGCEPDVTVRFGALPDLGTRMQACGPGMLQFAAPETGRYRIGQGREIVVDPVPGASERNLCVYLLGSAFGALLHQRGLLPLHANALVVEGRAIAFMGRSGAGKSTLAAWFRDRGHSVLADDVCAIALAGGEARVLPGVPRLRLWKDALERSGREAGDFEPSFDGEDKFDLPAPEVHAAAPAPLAALYLLEEAESDGTIEPLGESAATEALIANTYRGRCIPLLRASERHFAACLELGRAVPVHRVRRRKDVAVFERTAERLEHHARELLAGLAPATCP